MGFAHRLNIPLMSSDQLIISKLSKQKMNHSHNWTPVCVRREVQMSNLSSLQRKFIRFVDLKHFVVVTICF
jgi:hypothetical protein